MYWWLFSSKPGSISIKIPIFYEFNWTVINDVLVNVYSLNMSYFYLLDSNICIEYDGIQHFEPVNDFGGEIEFNNIQIRDNIKNEYCKNNNINLIRIRYDENIEEKIKFLYGK